MRHREVIGSNSTEVQPLELRATDGNPLVESRFTFAQPLSDEAFISFAAEYPAMHIEREGNTIVMTPPQGNNTDILNAELVRLVGNWNAALPKPGAVYGSSTLFGPPTKQKGPDCAWASPERRTAMLAAGQTFSPLVPNIVFELRSHSDAWTATIATCRTWRTMGAESAVAIDPIGHRIDVSGDELPAALQTIAHTIANGEPPPG